MREIALLSLRPTGARSARCWLRAGLQEILGPRSQPPDRSHSIPFMGVGLGYLALRSSAHVDS